jgi:hypothetical protein
MKPSTLFAPAALVVAGFFATPSQAHAPAAQVAVGVPPIVVDTGVVHVSIGRPPPPPPVIVTTTPRETVVVRREVIYTEPVVRERVVYIDDDCDDRGHPGRGHAYGKYKNKHKGKHDKHARAQTVIYRR